MIAVWLSAGRAAPGPNRPMVRVLPIASVHDGVASSAKSSVYQVGVSPRGRLVEGDQALDVVGDDPCRDVVHGGPSVVAASVMRRLTEPC